METASPVEYQYRKIEIDNAICNRRFHIAFEEGQKLVARQTIACPHCGVVLWEEDQFPPAILLREENLVKSPDGSRPMLTECQFLK
jgi:hypothetical protein